jgi:uncharacterized protein YuzE
VKGKAMIDEKCKVMIDEKGKVMCFGIFEDIFADG